MNIKLIRAWSVGIGAMCLLLAIFIGCGDGSMQERMEPPVAMVQPESLTVHGDTRIDNYYWLNQRENPEVISYLEAENEYLNQNMQHTESLQASLFEEITGRIKKDDSSVPYLEDGYYYYTRYVAEGEYPIYCRRKGSMDGEEEVLLNVNELAEGYDYYQVRGLSLSPDNKTLAFGVDTVSRRKYTIHFKNMETGEIHENTIPNTTGGSTWGNDNETVFYATKDSTLRSHKIVRHILGTDYTSDVEVWHESDNTFSCYVWKSKSKRYIFIMSYHTLSSEFKFIDADNPRGELHTIQARERDLEYSVSHYGDKFYIVTNHQAMNFRLMEAPVSAPGKSNWKEVIAHRDDVLLEDVEIFKDYLVVRERKEGLVQLRIIPQTGGEEHYLDFGEPAYSAYVSVNKEFGTDILRYGYSSMTTPNSIYDYNMKTREKELLKQDEVLGGYDPAGYTTERVYATARDGARVPISLVYKNGVERDATNPLLLYAYGSYGSSQNASFRSTRLSLLDRGFVYAIAHVRGGQEMGRHWYEDGKLLSKKNTFTDYIDCAEHLVAEKFTNPEMLFGYGGSAGGLLIGAVSNMRPDLFKGLVAAVPFVDVITTMLDETIPLTTSEFDEWGNPKDKTYYDYILSYSPYDQVEAKNYPALLVTTGLHDSQVQYWEPAKWVAKLRAMKTDNNALLLRTQMEAGHSGASGRFERYHNTALVYAFLLDLAGIEK